MAELEEFVVADSVAGERVDRAVAMLTGWTRSEVQTLIEAGLVRVGGERVIKSRKLEAGEVVEISGVPEVTGPPEPDASITLVIRYEEDDLTTAAQELACVAGICEI